MRARTSLPTLAVGLLVAVLLAGCSEDPAPSGGSAAQEQDATPAAAEAILAERDLDGMEPVELIDLLDRLGGEDRPADLMASVRPDELVVTADGEEASLPIDGERFYLSVAPYVDQTHECFYHSLTTCQGELVSTDVEVRLVDETNDEVLVEGTRTTFENGFVGFWLPRGIEGTLEVEHAGKSGTVEIGTGPDDPTCLTTLQLT